MIDAMKQALEALEYHQEQTRPIHKTQETITALRQAIAEAEKESILQEISDIGQWDTSDMAHRSGGLSVEQALNGLAETSREIEQEPVAWMFEEYGESSRGMRWFKCLGTEKPQHPESTYRNITPLYTAPVKREWVGLTDEEIKNILDCGRGGLVDIKKAEQILKEKNNG
jgi:hypothetical protein